MEGTICAIFSSSWRFSKLKPGPVPESCYLRLVEGLFYEDMIIKLVMHKFEVNGKKTLSDLVHNHGWKAQEFVKQVFNSEPIVVIECNISTLPLCQIRGSHMFGWGVDPNILHESVRDFLSVQSTTQLLD